MSPRFEIVEAKRHHCGIMARAMRRDHLEAMLRVGAEPHRELRDCFDQSAFRKAWLIDGRLAALGGVIGTLANSEGMLWLALSEEATHYPKAVIQEAQRQIDALMMTKRRLHATIMDGDESGLRLAIFLRFQVLHTSWSGPAGTKAGRRLLAREIAANPDLRIVVDGAAMIPMEFKQEAA